ncbi:hypothetical protein ACI2UK_13805 [Ralstonia nicotianae]|uniref:hypothetical protein n=1 Tax=Ralstonia pseudosolanacearum TaxID=1310165 RepID=UPI002004A778|nr:hypothetical protein [Ralstonia pseudosolanacearum]MCK4118382.1 hypothetical protein [Ralstonia pseudosolanacearum]
MESLLDLVKTPVRFFITALVLYMAAHSFFIAVVVAVVFLSLAWHSLKRKTSAVPAAPVILPPKPTQAEAPKAAPVARPAANAATYAKSAVVTPMLRSKSAPRS